MSSSPVDFKKATKSAQQKFSSSQPAGGISQKCPLADQQRKDKAGDVFKAADAWDHANGGLGTVTGAVKALGMVFFDPVLVKAADKVGNVSSVVGLGIGGFSGAADSISKEAQRNSAPLSNNQKLAAGAAGAITGLEKAGISTLAGEAAGLATAAALFPVIGPFSPLAGVVVDAGVSYGVGKGLDWLDDKCHMTQNLTDLFEGKF